MIYISLPNDINFICGGLEKHLKSLKLDFKSPADALKDSDWLFHPICELFRKDNRLTVFFSPSLSRKRFRRWASVTIPTLCRTTRLLWWRMSCGWSWSCSVAVSPAHLSFFLQSNRLISSWLHPSTEKANQLCRIQFWCHILCTERTWFGGFLKAASEEALREVNKSRFHFYWKRSTVFNKYICSV